MCQNCCAKSGVWCGVAKHKRSLVARVLPIVTEAIDKKLRLTIRYNGGTFLPRQDRTVEPTGWKPNTDKNDRRFFAVCTIQRDTREFILSKVMDARITDK